MCHNPNASESARRPADGSPSESIDFKRMIHRIHTGEELTQDFTIYGFFTPPAPPNRELQRGALPGRPSRLHHVPRDQHLSAAARRRPYPDATRFATTTRLSNRRRGVPRVPRHAVRGGARVRQHGALRGGLRVLPRSERRVRRRQGPCTLRAGTRDNSSPARFAGRGACPFSSSRLLLPR